MNQIKTTLSQRWLWSIPFILLALLFLYLDVLKPLLTPYTAGLDGVDYVMMGQHLAHGIGTYWAPKFSVTRYQQFYEHMPVGIWYFSLFYRIFGDSWYVDKIIAAVDGIWMLGITCLFFKRDFPTTRWWLTWLPIIILLSNTLIQFYIVTNKFECIEVPFTMSLIYWISQCRYQTKSFSKLTWQAIIAGLFCVVGFEINGPLFLYVWGIYIICAWTSDRIQWRQAWYLTGVIVFTTLLAYILLMLCIPTARHNNWMYFTTQLFPSLTGHRTDTFVTFKGLDHLWIFGNYLLNLCPWIITIIAIWAILEFAAPYVFQYKSTHTAYDPKAIKFYILLILITSLPLLVSAKVLSFYNLHTNPYFCLLLCTFITPTIIQWYQLVKPSAVSYGLWLAIALMCGYLHILQFNHISAIHRYSVGKQAYLATKILSRYIPKNSIVSEPPQFLTHAITNLEPNLGRFLNVSLLPGSGCQYYITNIYDLTPIPQGYHLVKTPLIQLMLYKRAHALPSCKPNPTDKRYVTHFGYATVVLI